MINYYVVDTETTGLSADKHEVTQISIVRCSDRVQLNKFIRALYPERATPKALEITGRTRADLMRGLTREEAVEACEKFFNQDGATPEHRCIIGHNIQKFDRKFLFALWESVGKTFPANLWLDTLPSTKEFAKKMGIVSESFNLETSLVITGCKSREGQHNALVDTQNTYLLYKKLEKYGIDFLPFTQRKTQESK